MSRPTVLLVEDDVSLQRFVSLVLEDLPLDLHCCGTVDEALSFLAGARVDLLITDLMLPGLSGFDLLRMLRDAPALRGRARLVVFSAGLTPEVNRRLAAKDVWRVLVKPCSVEALEACVREAVWGEGESGVGHAAAADPAAPVVTRNFAGNEALHRAFRAQCLRQFVSDIEAGDQACARRDAPTLRRLAHSLKSVLLTLGHDAESACARKVEQGAEAGDWPAALAGWQELRAALGQLA